MAKFKVEFDVDVHEHALSAHRHFIGTMLDHVKQAVGNGIDNEGEVVTPAIGAAQRAVIGSWKIEPDELPPWDELIETLAEAQL